MLPDRRAIVFDLDDTLYPQRRFVLSGFLAVARHLERIGGLDARLGFAALAGYSRGAARGREIQACLAQHDLDPALAPELIDVLRYHAPRLRLPRASARVLADLRRAGWRLGVLTNGQPTIQRAKVTALGLERHVDAVVYATACGAGQGKPDAEPFAEIARRLAVPPPHAVMVGDDERCDVGGALAAGMLAIRCVAWTRADAGSTAAPAAITHLSHVLSVAPVLLEEASNRHAA